MANKQTTNAMMITNKEFFKQACRWKDTESIQTAAEWWAAFQEVIVREVFYNGKCRVPGLGTFTVRQEEGKTQTQRMANGQIVSYKVPPRIYPLFAPEDDFINDVNMQGVTKAYRKRLKKGELKARDYERELRAESVKMIDVVSDMVEMRREKAQEEFQELMARKRLKKIEANKRNEGKTNNAVPVIQMDLDGNEIARFESMKEATRVTGIDTTHISCACSGLYGRKTANGYRWKYAEKELEEDELSNKSKDSDTEP